MNKILKNEELKKYLQDIINGMNIEYDVKYIGTSKISSKLSSYNFELRFIDCSKSYYGLFEYNQNLTIPRITVCLFDEQGNERPMDDIISTYLHEIVHYIQYKERQYGNGKRRRVIHGKWFDDKLEELINLYVNVYKQNIKEHFYREKNLEATLKQLTTNFRNEKRQIKDMYYKNTITLEEANKRLKIAHRLYIDKFNEVRGA